MGGQQKDFISDIVFFQHQDGMRLKVRRHFLQWGSHVLFRQGQGHGQGLLSFEHMSIPAAGTEVDIKIAAQLEKFET
jgi:hypothetical protein